MKAAYGGLSEAKKVAEWKYDLGEEQKRTLNAINMLGYTNAGNNQQLAGEIWNGTKNVEYKNLDGEYGHFNSSEDPNKVILSDALLGKGKEASAMLATVMSHEGTHVYGNRIEGVAHLAGLQTYSQLGEMFKLKGNKSFTESMEKAFYDEKSWKENTGDVDYWILMNDGTLVNDGTGWLVDESGLYVNIDGTRSNKPKKGKTLGAGKLDEKGNAIQGSIETGLLNILANSSGKIYDSFSDTEKLYSYSILKCSGFENDDPEMQKALRDINWTEKENKPINMDLVMRFAGDTVATAVFVNYFDSTVDALYADLNGIDIGTVDIYGVSDSAKDRFNNLFMAKESFYDSMQSVFDLGKGYYMSGEFKGTFTDKAGNKRYKDWNFLHFGGDYSREEGCEGDDIYAGISGRIFYKDRNSNSNGTNLTIEYGYMFNDLNGTSVFNSINLFGDYYHMQENSNSNYNVGDIVSADSKIGKMGNTGVGSAAHLHFGFFTRDSENYNSSTLKIILGNEYNSSQNSLRSSTKYWEKQKYNDPTSLNNAYPTYRTAYNPNLFWNSKLKKEITIKKDSK